MKAIFSVTVLMLLFSAIALAQQGLPPPARPAPAAPEYAPYLWKEYSFADDGVRFKFPVQPKREDRPTVAGSLPSHVYTRQSFMMFQLGVSYASGDKDLEADPHTLDRAKDNEINYLKDKNLSQRS